MTNNLSWYVGVVIPARNEQDSVGASVRSVRRALAVSGQPGRIVVVADSCDDQTAQAAREAAGIDGEVLECAVGSAGAARRMGTDWLLATTTTPVDRLWMAATDADSTVAPSWLEIQLRLADAGADAVAGIVRLDRDCDPALAESFRRSYVLRSDGTHAHVHGANMGVRADAYLAVGGWEALATGEDNALWRRLGRAGWTTVASIEPWVVTSSRLNGRAPAGFSADLAALEKAT